MNACDGGDELYLQTNNSGELANIEGGQTVRSVIGEASDIAKDWIATRSRNETRIDIDACSAHSQDGVTIAHRTHLTVQIS